MNLEEFLYETGAENPATMENTSEAFKTIKFIESELEKKLYELNLCLTRLYEDTDHFVDVVNESAILTPGEKKVWQARARRVIVRTAVNINATGRSNEHLIDLLNK